MHININYYEALIIPRLHPIQPDQSLFFLPRLTKFTTNPNIKSDKIWVYSRIETRMQKLIAYESAFIVINHSEQHFREEHDMYLCILKKNWEWEHLLHCQLKKRM